MDIQYSINAGEPANILAAPAQATGIFLFPANQQGKTAKNKKQVK